MPQLVKSASLTPEELADYQVAARQRAARFQRKWEDLFIVLPIAQFPDYLGKSPLKLVGFIHLRHRILGLRWSVQILEGIEHLFARHAVYCGQDGRIASCVFFDTAEESEAVLVWAFEVWQNAIRDGQMDLPFAPITSPRDYFYAVDADRRLLPNRLGLLPWAASVPSPRSLAGGGDQLGGAGAAG